MVHSCDLHDSLQSDFLRRMDLWGMARGGHGLPKVSPGPPCPTLPRPAGRPPLKRLYGRFRGGPPTGRVAHGRLYPFGHPAPYAKSENPTFENSIEPGIYDVYSCA
jgi:hypothetical protein